MQIVFRRLFACKVKIIFQLPFWNIFLFSLEKYFKMAAVIFTQHASSLVYLYHITQVLLVMACEYLVFFSDYIFWVVQRAILKYIIR